MTKNKKNDNKTRNPEKCLLKVYGGFQEFVKKLSYKPGVTLLRHS